MNMNDFTKLIEDGKYRKAESVIRKELSCHKKDVYLLTQLANVLWNQNKDKEALYYANIAREVDCCYPLLLYTRGRILYSLEMYEESISEWTIILNMQKTDLSNKGWGMNWALSVINDARFYKADCLYHLFRDKEALSLIVEHLKNRRRGLESDFTKKEALAFYKIVKYSKGNECVISSNVGYATPKQSHRIQKRMSVLEKEHDCGKMIKYLKIICKHYPNEYYYKTILSEYLNIVGNYKECLLYAKEAFNQIETDPLVKYNYAIALYLNKQYKDAEKQFIGIIKFGVYYIAFSEHGEGLKWAKRIIKDTRKYIEWIKSKSSIDSVELK